MKLFIQSSNLTKWLMFFIVIKLPRFKWTQGIYEHAFFSIAFFYDFLSSFYTLINTTVFGVAGK